MSFYPHRTEKRTNEVSTGYKPRRSQLLTAALGYARRGVPVFRLRPGTKEPFHGSRGFYDATTDEGTIRRWWRECPDANIGIPTGERSGLLVLDVDHPAGLDVLEADHGKLPATRTHSTGNGGIHYLFEYPAGEEFRNSAGKLAHGLDVRANGGYIVAPPSRTTRPYEVLDRLLPASPPGWLLEALRQAHSAGNGDAGTGTVDRSATAPRTAPVEGSIPEGARNWTLYRIACSLRARGADAGGILETLERENADRCAPPLEAGELERIAGSATRHPAGTAASGPTPEVLEALEGLERASLWGREWRGMGGKSERDVYAALLKIAARCGTVIPAGVRVSVSIRALALAAAVSKRAMLDYRKGGERKPGIIRRLKERGLIRSDSTGGRDGDSGAFVLVTRAEGSAGFHHSTTGGGSVGGGETLRSPRLRWSAPAFDRVGGEIVRSTVRRLGKTCGAVLDALERDGGTATVPELAAALETKRPRDLRRRVIARLEAAGVVECSGDTVALSPDWLAALDREREVSGEITAYRRDMARYARERAAYRERRKARPGPAPAPGETRLRREDFPQRRRVGIESAIAALFADRPEYRGRRVGQIVCRLHGYLPADFPRGPIGHPKDHEVEAILDGEDVAA